MLALVCVTPTGVIFAEDAAITGEPAVVAQEPAPEMSTEEASAETAVEEDQNSANDDSTLGADGAEAGVPEGDARVTTGDAVSGVEVENAINTNTLDTAPAEDSTGTTTSEGTPDTGTEIEDEDAATTTPELLSDDADVDVGTTTLSVENENAATSTTSVASDAETGANEASAGMGTASVDSGNSYAYANVLNLVNSNLTGANGDFQLLNLFGSIFGDLSLSVDNGAECSFLCLLTQLFVANYNQAYLENNIAVSASTGMNMASSTLGDASVATGDAFAAANVVNVVNTNIVSSEYLAFIMNAFGSWEGDLVLPP
ncbi:MAG: hypothetical protein AAB912_00690, partial [Patescibacteria group bacterium]